MKTISAPFPALRLLMTVCMGIIAGVWFSLSVYFWIVLSLASLCLLCFLLVSKLKRQVPEHGLSFTTVVAYSFFVFSSFAAFSDYAFRYVASDTVMSQLGKKVLLYGKVVSRPHRYGNGAQWIFDVREVFSDGESRKATGKIKVFLRLDEGEQLDVEVGDMIRIKGSPARIPGAANPGDFNAHEHYWKQGVHAELFCPGPWVMRNYGIDEHDFFEVTLVRPVRRYISRSIDELVPPGHERQFLKGIFLGQRELLDREVYRQFQAAGTAHVLAVSGLHVGLIVIAMLVLLQRFRTTVAGRWMVFLFIAFVLLVYCSVTGNAPSVRRASIMAVVLIGGSVTGRRSFPLNSLAAADLVILSLDPLELFSAGFLMTNTAVASIILLYPTLSRSSTNRNGLKQAIFRPVWNAFSVSLAAVIGVAPVIAWFFGTFSLAGLIANLPVVFLVSCMLYTMLPAFVLNLVLPGLAIYPASSAWFFAKITLGLTDFFGSQHWAVVQIRPDAFDITVYYMAILASLYLLHRQKPMLVLTTLLCTVNYFVWTPVLRAGNSPLLATVTVGRNVALLFSASGSSILIDAGSKLYHQGTINRQMRRSGVEKLDAAVQFASQDSLVAAIGASHYMLSRDKYLVLPDFVLARPHKHLLKLWISDGSSIVFAANINALLRLDSATAERVIVKVKRFGIEEYLRFERWLDTVQPSECIVLSSSGLKERERGLLRYLDEKHEMVTID